MSNPHEQLEHLGDDQLFAIARNDSAIHEFRVAALEILQKKGLIFTKYPGLLGLVVASTAAEVAHESEIDVPSLVELALDDFGPFKASVTTESMFGVHKMDGPEEIVPELEAQEPEQK